MTGVQTCALPICTHILSDPTAFEEPLLDATISVVLESSLDGNVILVSQLGSGAISSSAGAGAGDAFSLCMQAAKERKKRLVQALEGR